MRKIDEMNIGTTFAKVYRDTENAEFVVKLFKAGKHEVKADYHTEDRQDAKQTAWEMLRHATK
jgi:hypothetical protein